MRTMSGSPCLHCDCSNRNSFGYCKTTVCINEHYQQEQWGSQSTANNSESAVIKQQTNADHIRAMTDKELAEWIIKHDCHTNLYGYDPKDAVLDWLKQEVES